MVGEYDLATALFARFTRSGRSSDGPRHTFSERASPGVDMNPKALASLLVAAALRASVATATDKPVYIFILSGQSNMAGMNPKARV